MRLPGKGATARDPGGDRPGVGHRAKTEPVGLRPGNEDTFWLGWFIVRTRQHSYGAIMM